MRIVYGLRRVAIGLAASAALAIAGTGLVLAADVDVNVEGFAYGPSRIEVAVGDTITWTNSDNASHTATADDGSWDSGSIPGGSSGSVTFESAGTFPYHCEVHPDMVGTVTVLAAGAEPTTPATSTVDPTTVEVRPASLVGAAAAVIGLAGIVGALGFGLRLRQKAVVVSADPEPITDR